ncbi:MAG TPA: hypothetical protein VFC73_06950 [Syntrophomonadaceae bacterium]|nr:hypothetical protein [Syntrophomonadaceae bacterium]
MVSEAIMAMKDEYIDHVLALLDGVRHDGYYVQMAVAWALHFVLLNSQIKPLKI